MTLLRAVSPERHFHARTNTTVFAHVASYTSAFALDVAIARNSVLQECFRRLVE